MVRNCSGTAGMEWPRVFARMDADVGEMLDDTPRKRSRIEKEDVNMESNSEGNIEATNELRKKAQLAVMILSSSLERRTWKHGRINIKALGGRCEPV